MIAFERVTFARNGRPVLRDLDFIVADGETVALVGRSGTGKSTTLKSIMGLVEVTRGSIRFAEREITRLPTHGIAALGIGYVPEDRRIFGDLTVEENLRVGEKGAGRWSTARVYEFFPKLAVACHLHLQEQQWARQFHRRGPRAHPHLIHRRRPWARTASTTIDVERRSEYRRHRRYCPARRHWKSLAHVRGGRRFLAKLS